MLQEKETTVFIVDDDEAVLNATKKLTETIGICSQTFHTGTDFLNAYDPSIPGCQGDGYSDAWDKRTEGL